MAKILLIESDAFTSDVYQRTIISAGFECDVAVSGKEAFEKILQTKYDLVFLEFELHEEKGLDVLRELRTNPAYDTGLKVVMLSFVTDRNMQKEAVTLSISGLLLKSDYPPMKIASEIQRYLHRFEEQVKNEERIRNGGPVPKNQKVLLVENEDVFIDMFGKRLRDEGYEVDIAINGHEGFEKASITQYHLIITDMIMPGMNGAELIEKLTNDDRTKKTPIFIFSASVTNKVLDEFRRKGIRCYLKTHLSPSELVREVNAFLESLQPLKQ